MDMYYWRKVKYVFALLSLVSLFILTGLPLMAGGIQVNVGLGFQEYVVPGRWSPLFIEVKGGDFTRPEKLAIEVCKAENRVDKRTIPEIFYLDLSGGISRIQIPVYIKESGDMINLKIKSGNRLLIEEQIDSRAKVFPGHIVLTNGIASNIQQAISKSLLPREPVNSIDIDLHDLPVKLLSYDGVSAMIITDQGHTLNPAQTTALRGWLAGGGTLVICNPRPESEGMLSKLICEGASPEASEFKFGFGRVIILPLSLSMEDPVYWRNLLSLKQYEDTKRLTPGQIFAQEDMANPDTHHLTLTQTGNKGEFELRLFILIWVLSGLALVYLLKPGKNHLRARGLILFTLISILSSIPLGRWVMTLWHRGAPIYTQAVLLPNGEGIIFNSRIGLTKDSSPWNLNLQLGRSEQGEINLLKNQGFWEHLLTTPTGLLQTSSKRTLHITGILPVERARARTTTESDFWDRLSAIVPSGHIGLYDGEEWLQLRIDPKGQANWEVKAGGAPDWVQNTKLVNRVSTFFPEYKWVFGLSPFPGFSLKLQGGLCNEVFWVTPVKEEVEL